MPPCDEEVIDFVLRDSEEYVADVSPSEPLDKTVHEFDGPAASFANSTAAARWDSLKSARKRLPHLCPKLVHIEHVQGESHTQIHETCI